MIAVNHDALVWKYLFAIFTSLQVKVNDNSLTYVRTARFKVKFLKTGI